jgi:hypothetical protein
MDVEGDGQQVIGVVGESIEHCLRVACRGDDAVAAGQRLFGDLQTETARCACDEPDHHA